MRLYRANAGDATADLLNVRLDEFNRLLLDGYARPGAFCPSATIADLAPRVWRQSAAGTLTPAGSGSIADGRRRRPLAACPDASRRLARCGGRRPARRDLLISFGILLLLR